MGGLDSIPELDFPATAVLIRWGHLNILASVSVRVSGIESSIFIYVIGLKNTVARLSPNQSTEVAAETHQSPEVVAMRQLAQRLLDTVTRKRSTV